MRSDFGVHDAQWWYSNVQSGARLSSYSARAAHKSAGFLSESTLSHESKSFEHSFPVCILNESIMIVV